MKILSKFFVLAFIASFFVSCGGSNDPTPTPVQKIILKTWTIPILGFAGQGATLKDIAINLSDIPGVDASNFIKGDFQNSGGYIQISGLNKMDGAVLNNFTMQVNSSPATNLGRVTANATGTGDFASDVQQSGNNVIDFLRTLFTAYTGKSKTATLTVTFTPSANIMPTDNVNLIIAVNGMYNWNTFPQ